jgi:hypothetical protein
LAADFFEAAAFFFLAGGRVARSFFFGSAPFDFPLADWLPALSGGLLSTGVFGILGTVGRF